jgi:solute carrier family 35, member F1/2
MPPHARDAIVESDSLLPGNRQEPPNQTILSRECGLDNGNHLDPRSLASVWHDLERRRDENASMKPRNKWLALAFGQFVALVATSQNAASFTLEFGMGKVFPMFLMFHTYIILSFHLCYVKTPMTGSHSDAPAGRPQVPCDEVPTHRIPFTNFGLRTPWWTYLCLSILDIGPNYLTLQAMNRTSLTSATLLGSLTIPSTMIFCSVFLGKVFRPMHFFGVVLSILGGTLTILTDKDSEADAAHPHSYNGDILAVFAALGYGIGDAAAEFWSKHVDRKEYLGMLGLFGTMWTLVIFLVFERDAVYGFFTDAKTILPTTGILIWYIFSLVAYYVAESKFLTKSDATLLNLSLQTSNLWAVLFSVLVFREEPPPQFYVAVALVAVGVFVYELCGNSYSAPVSQDSEPPEDAFSQHDDRESCRVSDLATPLSSLSPSSSWCDYTDVL